MATSPPCSREAPRSRFSATDPLGASASQTFEVIVTEPASDPGVALSPLFLQVADGAATVDVSSAFTAPATGNLAFTATSSDEAVATVAVAGAVVTVTPVLHGTATVTVTATDNNASSTTGTFDVTVANRLPQAVGTLSLLSLRVEDGAATVDASGAFSDPDDDDLAFAATSSSKTVATVATAGSVVTVTPLSRGTTTVAVTATDVEGGWAAQEFEVTVANRSPTAVGTLAALSLRVEDGDRAVDVSGAFSDPDDDDLIFAATSSDETAATVAVVGAVATVAPVSRGTTTIGVTATDVEGELATQEFEVTVANRPPEAVGTLPALTLRVEDGDETVNVSGAFNDPDDDDLTYAATSSNEAAATVAAAGSMVTVTPVSGGRTNVTVTATDEENGSATQEFEVTVVNRAPQAVGSLVGPGLQVGDGNQSMDIVDAFEDLDEDRLTYSASSSAPAVAQASVSGSRVTLRPVGRGTATITVAATDIAGSNTPATQTFDVQVKARRGVSVSTDALTVNEGTTAAYTVVLDSEPTGQVVVTPSVVSSTEVTVDPLSLTFDEVDWATPKTVTVEGAQDQDAVSEPPVTIRHQVSGSDYGPVTAASVRVTVVEDDAPTLSVEASESVEDGGSLTFEVTLSLESSSEVTVDYATSDGSGAAGARAGLDYTASDGTLTFPANSTASRQIVVDITDDGEDEEEEELFRLTLGEPAECVPGGRRFDAAGCGNDSRRRRPGGRGVVRIVGLRCDGGPHGGRGGAARPGSGAGPGDLPGADPPRRRRGSGLFGRAAERVVRPGSEAPGVPGRGDGRRGGRRRRVGGAELRVVAAASDRRRRDHGRDQRQRRQSLQSGRRRRRWWRRRRRWPGAWRRRGGRRGRRCRRWR